MAEHGNSYEAKGSFGQLRYEAQDLLSRMETQTVLVALHAKLEKTK